MKQRLKRRLIWMAMMLSGASLFAATSVTYPITGMNGAGGGGCTTFATNGLTSSIDFCYIFDCDRGFAGGAIQPCGTGGNFLVDCPGGDATDEGSQTSDQTTTSN